jgi:hypothetical protein
MPAAGIKVKPIVSLCIVLFLVFIASVGASFFQSPGIREFQFHRTRYEQILTKVKASGIKPGEFCRLSMTANLNPDSLTRKRNNNADMVGKLEVYRDEDSGAYQFIVTTLDRGHIGSFGYAYSEIPNKFPNIDQVWESEHQINSHWWIAANRSW